MYWRKEEESVSIRTVQIGEMKQNVVLYILESRRTRNQCQLCMNWRKCDVELYFLEKKEKMEEI